MEKSPGARTTAPRLVDRRRQTRVALLVGAILLLALALRIGYVESTSFTAIDDAGTYNRLGAMVARHADYNTGSGPNTGAGGSRGPTAYFPPGYPFLIGLVDLIDGHLGHKPALQGVRVAGAVIGTVSVGLLGLVALEAFGGLTAIVALALAAVYPVGIELSGTIVAENLVVVFVLAAVWAGLRAQRSRAPVGWIAASGILTGLAALTHENAIVLVIPLAVAATSAITRLASGDRGHRARPGRRRILQAAVGPLLLVVFAAGMIAPWTIRNAVELHHFVPISDETGITLVGAYNPASAASAPIPYKWRYYATIPQDARLAAHAARYTELQLEDTLQSQAEHYISSHPSAPLQVAWTNLRRMFELDGSYAWRQGAHAIGLHEDIARIGVIAFWVLCALSLCGLLTRAVRTSPWWLWAVPVLYALSILLVNVETPRFREPIDPFLLLLAACGIAAGLERRRDRRDARLRSAATGSAASAGPGSG